jgi:hypothetical protein
MKQKTRKTSQTFCIQYYKGGYKDLRNYHITVLGVFRAQNYCTNASNLSNDVF